MSAPAWYRYGLTALATLMLCSCRAALPAGPDEFSNNGHPQMGMPQGALSAFPLAGEQFPLAVNSDRRKSRPSPRAAASEQAIVIDDANFGADALATASDHFDVRGIQHRDMPAVYWEDPHMPPPAIRQAEYAAGIVASDCPCCNHDTNDDSYGDDSVLATDCQAECVECMDDCNLGCAPQLCTPDCPLVGPRDEYLCDGGDAGLPVGVRADWTVDGLEQEDTVAHYDTVDGSTFVTPSNQVCIYAPRFGVVRKMVDLHEYMRADMPGGFETPLSLAKIDEQERATTSLAQVEPTINRAEDPATLMRDRTQLGELGRTMVVEEIDGSLAPYADMQIIRAGSMDNGERALLARSSLAAITWAGDESPHITINERHAQASVRDSEPGVVYHLHDPKKPQLRLIKLASAGSAKPGDEVEFTLRFDNIGSQVMGNVTIMDNLTTRLEFVEGSARSDVEANFSAEANSSGSAVLRWEITEPLEAGQGGILQFKCKVR